MAEREEVPLSFVGFQRLPQSTPPPQTPHYLTILMTERGVPLSFVGFWSSSIPPPPPPRRHDT